MTTKLPYAPPGKVGIPNLDPFFGPGAPALPDAVPPPDLMLQNPDIIYTLQILDDVIVGDRTDVFIDTNSIVYYDPADRNRRVQPGVYIAFDVDADAIRHRNGYVIWEVGKPPDFVLEVASESTADNDTGRKRDLYARIGVLEYWRFDRTGGELYGAGLAGERLENGLWRPLPTHTDSNGATWGHSPLLNLNLRAGAGRLELQDPNTREALTNRRGQRLAKIAAEDALAAALQERDAATMERDAVTMERDDALTASADYQEQIRRLQERLWELGQSPE